MDSKLLAKLAKDAYLDSFDPSLPVEHRRALRELHAAALKVLHLVSQEGP